MHKEEQKVKQGEDKETEDFGYKRKFTEEEISNFPQKIKRLITLEYLILGEVK